MKSKQNRSICAFIKMHLYAWGLALLLSSTALCIVHLDATVFAASLDTSKLSGFSQQSDSWKSSGITGSWTSQQGAATDGTYVYVVYLTSNHVDALLVKWSMDGQVVSYKAYKASSSSPNALGHANDMTYNPNTGMLAITAWSDASNASKNNGLLRLVDPGTLSVVDTVKISGAGPTNVCYDSIGDRYFGNNIIYTIDGNGNFKQTGSVKTDVTGGNGLDCDHDYIYAIWKDQHQVRVYDWSGKLVTTYAIPSSLKEPESIIISRNSSSGFTVLIGDNNSSTDDSFYTTSSIKLGSYKTYSDSPTGGSSSGGSTIARLPAGSVGLVNLSSTSVVDSILNIMYYLLGIVAVVVIILSGYRYVTSNGDVERATQARKMIIYAVVGLAIALSAFIITGFIVGRF